MVRASISWHLSISKVEGSNPGASFLFRVEILKKKGSDRTRINALAPNLFVLRMRTKPRFSEFEFEIDLLGGLRDN